MDTGTRLKLVRERNNLSQRELARRSGLTNSTISQIEHGRYKPYPVQLARLASALGWAGKPEALLEDTAE